MKLNSVTSSKSKIMKKHIVIAIDLSESTSSILNEAFDFASHLNAKITLVSIISMYVDYLHSDMSLLPTQWEDIYNSQKEFALNELNKIKDAHKELEIEIHAAIGNPKFDVIDFAKEAKADYIVMGTHGRTGLSHLVIGSTAEYIIRHATIPVLIIPQKTK